MPASQAARLAPSAPPSRSVSSSRILKFSPAFMPRPPETTIFASPQIGTRALRGVDAQLLGAERVDGADGARLDGAGGRRRGRRREGRLAHADDERWARSISTYARALPA